MKNKCPLCDSIVEGCHGCYISSETNTNSDTDINSNEVKMDYCIKCQKILPEYAGNLPLGDVDAEWIVKPWCTCNIEKVTSQLTQIKDFKYLVIPRGDLIGLSSTKNNIPEVLCKTKEQAKYMCGFWGNNAEIIENNEKTKTN